MPDREKVIKETEDGIAFAESRGFGGLANTMRDAIALLKEQKEKMEHLNNITLEYEKEVFRLQNLLKEQDEEVKTAYRRGLESGRTIKWD